MLQNVRTRAHFWLLRSTCVFSKDTQIFQHFCQVHSLTDKIHSFANEIHFASDYRFLFLYRRTFQR